MKVNVYGLTEATISFTTLNMILRGKYSKNPKEHNLGSVAYNLVLENEHQANELKAIAKLGLIHVEVLEDIKVEKPKLEDIIKFSPREDEPQNDSRRNRRRELAEHKNESEVAKIPPASDLSVPTAAELTVPTVQEIEAESRVVVMTEKGPRGGKMVHKMNGEIDENDPRCKASMEAAEELKAEEERLADLIDDSLLDPSEKMGSPAVVGTGSGKAAKVDMRNSVVGNREEPNFIDLGLDDEDDAIENAFSDDEEERSYVTEKSSVDNAFIDFMEEEKNDEEDELGDAFIEI